MENVNKTLYIPLYGKAFVSQKGIILSDKKAEEIWEKEYFPLKRRSRSKWLAYFMGMRAAVFDRWVKAKTAQYPGSVVLHLGCGLDSRAVRIGEVDALWYDVDLPPVIAERRRHYRETDTYRMLSFDIGESALVEALPLAKRAILLLEGVSMYLPPDALQQALKSITSRFAHASVLLDCYTPLAAKMSKIKNPINDVGVKAVYGMESPCVLEKETGLDFIGEHELTPAYLIDELCGSERFIFKHHYAGGVSKKLYKLYEYEA